MGVERVTYVKERCSSEWRIRTVALTIRSCLPSTATNSLLM